MLKDANSFVFFDSFVLIKWDSGDETVLSFKALRLSCPCAFCSGEKDVFGNKYIGEKKKLPSSAYLINKYSLVGLYGVKFYFEDGHSDGIYTFDLLKSLPAND